MDTLCINIIKGRGRRSKSAISSSMYWILVTWVTYFCEIGKTGRRQKIRVNLSIKIYGNFSHQYIGITIRELNVWMRFITTTGHSKKAKSLQIIALLEVLLSLISPSILKIIIFTCLNKIWAKTVNTTWDLLANDTNHRQNQERLFWFNFQLEDLEWTFLFNFSF